MSHDEKFCFAMQSMLGRTMSKVKAAEKLRVSRQTIYNMIADKRLDVDERNRVTTYSVYMLMIKRGYFEK